jgi:hypothetical protein
VQAAMWVLGTDLWSSKEQPVLLTTEPSLQPPGCGLFFFFFFFFKEGVFTSAQVQGPHSHAAWLHCSWLHRAS